MVDERNEEGRVEAALANPENESTGWLETIYRNASVEIFRVTGEASPLRG